MVLEQGAKAVGQQAGSCGQFGELRFLPVGRFR
jgi:hypothetical protein